MTEEAQPQERNQEAQKSIWTAIKDNAAVVAAIIALVGVLVTGVVNTYIANKDQVAQRKLEAFNAERQRELEQEKAQNAALQNYLDQMGQMLLNQDLDESKEGSELRTLARARTLSVFEQSSPEGKRIAMVFLNEGALIDSLDPIILLVGADLSGIDLNGTDFSLTDIRGVNLSDADLSDANLSMALLDGADLSDADLSGAYMFGAKLDEADLNDADLIGTDLDGGDLSLADLSDADLSGGSTLKNADLGGANLSGSNLRDADLSGVSLVGADLDGADLSGANLGGANLSNVEGITNEELQQEAQALEGATMPNGQKYEVWLKSKGSEDDGENDGSS